MTDETDTLDAPLIAIDPRSCNHCGLKLDDHFTVDEGDGPLHFCQPLDVALHLRALRLQEAWERSDARDGWMHTGEPPPPARVRNGPQPTVEPAFYRTAQSTIDAFFYLVSLKDPDRLVAWLQDRERDRPFLLKLLEAR